ncbi:DnaJ family protein [Rhodotorula toruloides]|uniref:DnaJ family protein n=1 Tax=Rhodotorula toruloides TaxID=5286 RepID=A0A511KB95_RHOTO|nr:DnaJ family protein [Rhodotorula toruloides]
MASEDVDYYALLEIESTASSAEIRKAYRQKSLKVHPDRNPDDPQAAALFHELSIAVDVLSDPSKRSTFDALLTARNARKARFAALDNKRKAMAEELERSERESKRAREGEKSRWAEVERLKEEGRRLREMRAQQTGEEGEKRAREAEEQRKRALEKARKPANGGEAAEVVELGPLDKTLKIKWLKSVHPSLVDDTSVISFLERTLAPANSDIDSVVLSSKTLANPAKGKHGSGVVAFKTLSAAVRLVRGKEADPEGKWKGFEVDWAAGEPPAALGAQAGPSPPPPRQSASPRATAAASSFSFAPASSTDEDTILARLRQKEREKLMDEMRRQDEADEGLAQ